MKSRKEQSIPRSVNPNIIIVLGRCIVASLKLFAKVGDVVELISREEILLRISKQ